jgi:feruloyl esterase
MTKRKLFTVFAALAMVLLGLSPTANAQDTAATYRPVRSCADLVRDYDIAGAKTHVQTATVVPAGAEPEHCDVRGYVEPAVRFQLKLPTTSYQGRYLQFGCGGFCGFLNSPPFADCGPNAGNAAVADTDDGHEDAGFGGTWAVDNQAARDDYFFRAPHVLSKASKRIIAAFYGAPPKHSYFNGCSNGGREALLLAQRYPDDFDGVIAAAPANYYTPLLAYQAWLAKSNADASGAPILTADKLPVLHNAVVAACDQRDGLTDGQLDDPRTCKFDPVALRCEGADQPDCLTAAQVEATRKLYAGPTDDQGHRLYPGNQTYGSELSWYAWVTPSPEAGAPIAAQLADNYLKYIGYPIGTPHSSLAEFQFTVRDLNRLTAEGRKANAMSLDLREFQRSGGKLVIWHGWSDQAIPAEGTLDYYQRLTERSGGLQATQKWARLFMIPSVYHCQGGSTLTDFDPFRELIGWVERGTAPEKVIAQGKDEQGTVVRTRPVFPYPLTAKYDGTGSPDDASNFVPAKPQSPPRDKITWAGTYLHNIPGPVAP